MDKIKSLKDIFIVDAPSSLCDMADSEKVKYIDSVMDRPEASRGIIVKFLLSSSARRTNNRIYTPKGQRAGQDSWTQPYAKPIINHHQRESEPFGRILSVEYVDNSQEAMKFFKSISDFTKFRDAVESDNPKAVYQALQKNNLLTRKDWPGLGALVARARITDRGAIEKFLDQRYLTFSAGAHSDRYICGPCGSDWATGDICEHSPGQITDEGEPVVFITGTFIGDEASVVNTPGNDISRVLSIEFSDAADMAKINIDGCAIDPGTIYHCDAEVEDEWVLPPRDFVRTLTDSSVQKFKDAIAGSTTLERSWIIRMHDALHSEWDWELRYRDGSKTGRTPLDVFSLHGVIHQMSMDQDFRGSLINGELDGFNSVGEPSNEYKINSEDSMKSEEIAKLIEDRLAILKNELVDTLKPTLPAPVSDTEAKVESNSKYEELTKDYAEALSQIDRLKNDLELLRNSATVLDTQDVNSDNESVQDNQLPPIVENPSIAGNGSGVSGAVKQLGDYEKAIVAKFKTIKDTQGEPAAKVFLTQQKKLRYLPRTFDISQYIQEND